MVPEFEDETIRELIEGNYRIVYWVQDTDIVILGYITPQGFCEIFTNLSVGYSDFFLSNPSVQASLPRWL